MKPRRATTTRRKTEAPEAGEGKGQETRERILNAAQDLLRRHGLAKPTVVDVARALDLSHATV